MTTTIEGMSELVRRLPQHLAPNERVALQALVERLHQLYGNNLLRVVLFGSKARGDFDDESDLDTLIVVRLPDDDYWKHRQQILDETYDIELEHNVVFSFLISDELDYRQMREWNLLLNRNIDRDGIVLWTSPRNIPLSA